MSAKSKSPYIWFSECEVYTKYGDLSLDYGTALAYLLLLISWTNRAVFGHCGCVGL